MTDFAPTFKGELQFRRYSDTSTQGQQVVFAVADREALECFIGKEGKRFAAMLVELTDDEQPVPNTPKTGDFKQREPLGDLCWRAVQWCRDPEFQEWIAAKAEKERVGNPMEAPSEVCARRLVLTYCAAASRKELDTNPEAALRFNQLIRGPYQKHLIARGIVR